MNTIERIINLINEKGTTKSKFLSDIGLNKNSFINWEKRGTSPSGETLSKIAAYFNVSTDYLLGNDNKTNDPATDKQLKFALFGDTEIDDDVLDDIKRLAKMHVELKRQKDKK